MSKVVTFLNEDPDVGYRITRTININNSDLVIPNAIFNELLFSSNELTIVITDGNAFNSSGENIDNNKINNRSVFELITQIDNLKQKKKVNICNRIWNGYDKYKSFLGDKCIGDCESIQCERFENYSTYLRNKQNKGCIVGGVK